MQPLAVTQLQLAPLGAGDLIDRTLRLYRRNFGPLIRASVPPVLVSAVGGGIITFAGRAAVLTGSSERLALYVMLWILGALLWATGLLMHLIVMGGASRNLVMHLLWGERVTARAIYRNVRARFFGLLGAAFLIGVVMVGLSVVFVLMWYLVVIIAAVLIALAVAGGVPVWLGAVVGIVLFAAVSYLVLWLYFMLFGRVAYVPQVMLVEGRGVFDAVSRSINLARKNARRLMAMFLFTTFGAWSVVWLLLLPLGLFGWVNGVEIVTLNQAQWPAWYAIGYEVVRQVGVILLVPVWMLGLSLLYVDERVRREGYDVELQAARVLGEMPSVPQAFSPLAPAVVGEGERPSNADPDTRARTSFLGLNDR